MTQLDKDIFLLEEIIIDYKVTENFESLEETSLKDLLDLFENNGENKLLDLLGKKLIELRNKM